jgi:hypothetical protein
VGHGQEGQVSRHFPLVQGIRTRQGRQRLGHQPRTILGDAQGIEDIADARLLPAGGPGQAQAALVLTRQQN